MRLTSILMKILMALTGLAWFGFLITHLTANLLILKGTPDGLNDYSAGLAKFGPLLWVAEAGLIVMLLSHIASAIMVTRKNRLARKQAYAESAKVGEASLASRTMFFGGILLLFFLIVHVRMFKFGDWGGSDGLYGLVIRSFKDPLIVGFYVASCGALGLHLSHGVASAFQTLGILKPSWRPKLREVGFAIGWTMALGFAMLPVWSFFFAKA